MAGSSARTRNSRRPRKHGTLILIGGREDKEQARDILSEVARRIGKGRLCIASVASRIGHELWEEYRRIFRSLGVKHFSHLDVVDRTEAIDSRATKSVEDIDGIFFTGGDQLKITSELGGTLVADRINEMYAAGGLIAGTSAGAAVMSETMLFSTGEDLTPKTGIDVRTAPGLGFIKNVIIDQHFAQRGRVGRLISAIAQNPKFLGVGINEDTAVIMEDDRHLKVLGSGAVYVLDAHEATDTNVSERDSGTLSLFNGRFHILSAGDGFDLREKKPYTEAR